MSELYLTRRELIDRTNFECGYHRVWVNPGDTARLNYNGDFVVEHNSRGTEDVCRDGYVLAHRPLRSDRYAPPPVVFYPPPPTYYPPPPPVYYEPDPAVTAIGSTVVGAGLGYALGGEDGALTGGLIGLGLGILAGSK